MAEPTPINIQIDPEALKAQIEEVVTAQFEELAMRLRFAADALDKGKFWEERAEWDAKAVKDAYDRGFANGKAADGPDGTEGRSSDDTAGR